MGRPIYKGPIAPGALVDSLKPTTARNFPRFGVADFGGRSGGYNYLTSLGVLCMAHDFALGVSSSGGVIDSIADQSGNGNTLTAAGGARPLLNAADAQFNNQPCAEFDGVDDVLRIASATLGGTWGPGWLAVVCRLVANVNGDVVQSIANTSARHAESTTSRVASNFGATTVIDSTSFTTGAHLIVSVADGTNLVRYIDGTASGTPSAYTGTIATGAAYALGATSSGAAGFSKVKIALALVGRSALTAQQAALLGDYCRTRFGTP